MPMAGEFRSDNYVDLTLDDILRVLSEVKIISAKPVLDSLDPQDAFIMRKLLQIQDPAQITLKQYVLAKAKICSQTLEKILACLSLDKIDQILATDLLSNLIYAYQHGKCTVDEIGTVIMQYMVFRTFKQDFGDNHGKSTIESVDLLGEDGKLNQITRDSIKKYENDGLYEGHIKYDHLDQIKPTSSHSQLNKIIRVKCFDYGRDKSKCSFLFYNRYLGLGFLMYKEDGSVTLEFPSFSALNQIFQNVADNSNSRPLSIMPMFGCFSFEIFEDFAFNPDRDHFRRPMGLPTYLAPALKKLFFGVGGDVYNPRYDNPKGFYDMLIAHTLKIGCLGVFSHDLFHTMQDYVLFLLERQLLMLVLNKMLQDPKYVAYKTHIMRMKHEVMDQRNIFFDFMALEINDNSEETEYFTDLPPVFANGKDGENYKIRVQLCINLIDEFARIADIKILEQYFMFWEKFIFEENDKKIVSNNKTYSAFVEAFGKCQSQSTATRPQLNS